MTLPDGLQAVRDTGVAWCTEKQFAEILDLIETLAGALEVIQNEMTCLGCGGYGEQDVVEYVTHEMALDACEPAMEGMPQTYHAPCDGCSGTGFIHGAGPTARAALDKYREFK